MSLVNDKTILFSPSFWTAYSQAFKKAFGMETWEDKSLDPIDASKLPSWIQELVTQDLTQIQVDWDNWLPCGTLLCMAKFIAEDQALKKEYIPENSMIDSVMLKFHQSKNAIEREGYGLKDWCLFGFFDENYLMTSKAETAIWLALRHPYSQVNYETLSYYLRDCLTDPYDKYRRRRYALPYIMKRMPYKTWFQVMKSARASQTHFGDKGCGCCDAPGDPPRKEGIFKTGFYAPILSQMKRCLKQGGNLEELLLPFWKMKKELEISALI